MAEGRLAAPLQVYKEIRQKNDELSGWAVEHKAVFKKSTDRIEKVAARLASEHGARAAATRPQKGPTHMSLRWPIALPSTHWSESPS